MFLCDHIDRFELKFRILSFSFDPGKLSAPVNPESLFPLSDLQYTVFE